jgi:hypothetical protein
VEQARKRAAINELEETGAVKSRVNAETARCADISSRAEMSAGQS